MSSNPKNAPADNTTDREEDMTPGRPKATGSRQQTRPDQGFQSGSPSMDEEATQHKAESPAPSQTQPYRDPAHWKTGEEPITASQKSYLSTLATEAGETGESPDSLTKAEASIRIEELREKTGR